MAKNNRSNTTYKDVRTLKKTARYALASENDTSTTLSRSNNQKHSRTTRLKGFEDGAFVRSLRLQIERALEKYPPADNGQRIILPPCSPRNRCGCGLCPRCMRQLRLRLLSFARDSNFHVRQWKFVTIRPDSYTIDPGDSRAFGKLKDRPEILRFLQIIRRSYMIEAQRHSTLSPLLLIGSLETVYNLVANRPTGKPFHLHFLVPAILSDDVIQEAAARCFRNGRTSKWEISTAVDIQPVKPGFESFRRVLSYCVKQPLRRKSRHNQADRFGKQQKLKSNELAELANNLGPHGCTGRLILAGLRYEGGHFRLLGVKSTSNNDVRENTDERSYGATAVTRDDV